MFTSVSSDSSWIDASQSNLFLPLFVVVPLILFLLLHLFRFVLMVNSSACPARCVRTLHKFTEPVTLSFLNFTEPVRLPVLHDFFTERVALMCKVSVVSSSSSSHFQRSTRFQFVRLLLTQVHFDGSASFWSTPATSIDMPMTCSNATHVLQCPWYLPGAPTLLRRTCRHPSSRCPPCLCP